MLAALFPLLFCYIAPALLGLVGVWHLINPISIWKLARLKSQSEGLATADAPTAGALNVLRIRGVFFLIVAIAFAVFSHSFFSNWQEPGTPHEAPPMFERPG